MTRPAARASDLLAERDPGLPALRTVLDPSALTEALGVTARIVWVRYKPGTSIVAAVVAGEEPMWVAAYGGPDKADKLLARGRRHGSDVRAVPGAPHTVCGPALTDRAVDRAARHLDRRHPGVLVGARVLRHNPHRRVVLDAGPAGVVRLGDDAPAAVRRLSALRAAGIAALPADALTAGAWASPRWGAADLGAPAPPEAAEAAGTALAALHGTPAGAVLEEGFPATWEAAPGAAAAVRAIAVLRPDLEERAQAVAAVTPTGGGRALIHGDFTADQVLVGDGVRLIDFDRAGAGDPARDLGSFTAERLLAGADAASTEGLLTGYRRGGGVVDADRVRRWTAASALLRVTEPFRRGQEDWPQRMEAALRVAEGAAR